MVVLVALCLQWKHSVFERVTISVKDCLSLTFIQAVDTVWLIIFIFKSKKPDPSNPVNAVCDESLVNRELAYQSVDAE